MITLHALASRQNDKMAVSQSQYPALRLSPPTLMSTTEAKISLCMGGGGDMQASSQPPRPYMGSDVVPERPQHGMVAFTLRARWCLT